jgi:N-formylglutamate deformylase
VRLLDAHSIRGSVPRLFAGELPDLNFGTNDGAAASESLANRVVEAAAGQGFSSVLNGRFKGGFITRHYGAPNHGVEAVQLELAQRTYVDSGNNPQFRPARAAALVGVLRLIVGEMLRVI